MKRTCIIGTGNRFIYFMKIFDYLISNQYIKIKGISNRSNKFSNDIKKYSNNLFNDYNKMIDIIKPDLIIILVSNENNLEILKNVYKKVKYICVETPIKNYDSKLSKEFNKKKIHILENWFYLPLEIVKKEIIKSNICGQLKIAINKNRTFKYHGLSQLRNYVDFNKEYIFHNNKSKHKEIELIQNEPKINDKILSKIGLYFDKYKIISDCLIKDNQLNFECYDKNNHLVSKFNYLLKDDHLSKIEIEINNKKFIWFNEYKININQNQYGSLKSIINFLENKFTYSPENHLNDIN